MTCPKCRTPLTTDAEDGVVTGLCATCGGMWLAGATLKGQLDRHEARIAKSELGHTLAIRRLSTLLVCPDCKVATLQLFRVNRVDIERCSRCTGVFLDRGEWTLLLRAPEQRPIEVPLHASEKGLFVDAVGAVGQLGEFAYNIAMIAKGIGDLCI